MKKAESKQIGGEHYQKKMQPWHIIDFFKLNFYEGNILKYILRRKGDRLEDLRKAKHYIEKEIENVKRKNKQKKNRGNGLRRPK